MMSFSENNSLLPGKIRNTGINIYLTSPLQRWVYIELFPKLSLLIPIRSPSIQLIKFGAIGLNAIIFSPLLIAADTGSQYGTNITI
ncbi:hypothetical protein ACUODJ_34250, partial [Escherichia sp. HC-CC]